MKGKRNTKPASQYFRKWPRSRARTLSLSETSLARLREVAGNCRKLMQRSGTKRVKGVCVLLTGNNPDARGAAAEVVATELALDLYRVDLAAVVSKYIGETEKNLRHLFEAAQQAGGVLFFDEADALFGKRTEAKDAHDRYANVEISYLLQQIEEYAGLAVLATNMRDNLDEPFLRRIQFEVPVSKRRRSPTTLG